VTISEEIVIGRSIFAFVDEPPSFIGQPRRCIGERRPYPPTKGLSPGNEPPWVGHEQQLIGDVTVGARRATALCRRARALVVGQFEFA
jgi:hypothetical protein